MNYSEANNMLIETGQKIGIALVEVVALRENYMMKKAIFENDKAAVSMEVKAINENATQTDINAIASTRTYKQRMDMITAESAYKAKSEYLKSLYANLDIAKEICANLRKEQSILGV